jgi:hypothetical protein
MNQLETPLCSDCKNKKGEVTKEYCLSNPLNPNNEEEPDWEHDGGWHISQGQNCREFCKENDILNINDVDSLDDG